MFLKTVPARHLHKIDLENLSLYYRAIMLYDLVVFYGFLWEYLQVRLHTYLHYNDANKLYESLVDITCCLRSITNCLVC